MQREVIDTPNSSCDPRACYGCTRPGRADAADASQRRGPPV